MNKGKEIHHRIAAYWAITEAYVSDSMKASKQFRVLSYEDLLTEKMSLLYRVLTELGFKDISDVPIEAFERPSKLSNSGRNRRLDVQSRLWSWKNELSPHVIEAIESIVIRFGFDDRMLSEPSGAV